MSERLSPTESHESLDRMGLLAESQDSGVYAMELRAMNDYEYVRTHWNTHHDVEPTGGELAAIADGKRVAYVGASNNVYNRIMDHAKGEVRQSAYLRVFPPTSIVDVWPESDPFEAEYNKAVELAGNGWTVVTDGEVIHYE